MSESRPQLVLVVQQVHAPEGEEGAVAGEVVTCLVKEVVARRLIDFPAEVGPPGGAAARKVGSSDELLDHLRDNLGAGVRVFQSGRAELELISHGTETSAFLFRDLEEGKAGEVLDELSEIAVSLWRSVAPRAIVGPNFVVRPINVDAPRPLPPRYSNVWPLGESAYFICHGFHDRSPIGDPEGVERICSSGLPDSLTRHSLDGLTIVRCSGGTGSRADLADEIHALEVWISSTLGLALHPEFRASGDRRVGLLGKREGPGSTILDPVTGFAYKAFAPAHGSSLEEADLSEVRASLRVLQTRYQEQAKLMVVLPTRESAIRNRKPVIEAGAAGVVYADDDGSLWNPFPAGRWERIDWDKRGSP